MPVSRDLSLTQRHYRECCGQFECARGDTDSSEQNERSDKLACAGRQTGHVSSVTPLFTTNAQALSVCLSKQKQCGARLNTSPSKRQNKQSGDTLRFLVKCMS
jgi:hypothetical protein